MCGRSRKMGRRLKKSSEILRDKSQFFCDGGKKCHRFLRGRSQDTLSPGAVTPSYATGVTRSSLEGRIRPVGWASLIYTD